MLSSLKLEKHPEKTFIGRIERGFDFLGYHFSRAELTVAGTTLENFAARALRLYEQEWGKPNALPRFGEYVRRRSGWVRAGSTEGGFVVFQGLDSGRPRAVSRRSMMRFVERLISRECLVEIEVMLPHSTQKCVSETHDFAAVRPKKLLFKDSY